MAVMISKFLDIIIEAIFYRVFDHSDLCFVTNHIIMSQSPISIKCPKNLGSIVPWHPSPQPIEIYFQTHQDQSILSLCPPLYEWVGSMCYTVDSG